MTSKKSIITEMPVVDIGAVIAHQGQGYEKYILTDQQTDDVSEKYLARFNQFVLRFEPDANGKVSYRILESGQGGDWENDVKRYLSKMYEDLRANRMNLKIDIDANMKRFKWLKEQNAEVDNASTSDKL